MLTRSSLPKYFCSRPTPAENEAVQSYRPFVGQAPNACLGAYLRSSQTAAMPDKAKALSGMAKERRRRPSRFKNSRLDCVRNAGPDPGHDQALRRPGQAKRERGPRVSTRLPSTAQNKAQDPAIKVNKAFSRRFCVNPRLEKQAFPCHGQHFVDAPIMRLRLDG